MTRKNKNNKIQEINIEKIVYEWLIQGWSNHNIQLELQNTYDFKKDNANRIIYKVLNNLVPKEEIKIEELKERYLNMFLSLYEKSLKDGDYRSCNEILKSIMKLQNLDTIKIDANVNTTFEVKFDNNDEKTND